MAELVRLPRPEIIAFDDLFSDVRAQADLWNGRAACWNIEYRYLSDDGFADFRAGLVAPADDRWDLRSEAEWSNRLPDLSQLFAARFQPN